MCIADKGQISYEILAYLADHPSAQDTLEGVVEWWLLEETIKDRTERVKEAIDDLVSKRLLLERKGKDERTHYRINRRRVRAISEILKRGPSQEL